MEIVKQRLKNRRYFMLDDNKNVVVETTENVVEQATETLVDGASEGKFYTQAELDRLVDERVDQLLPRKLERAKDKMAREFESKYEKTERVLKAGLGVKTLDEATNQLEDFYTRKGIKIPEKTYSESDMRYLADKYADEVIEEGYDEVVREVDKLAKLGESMNPQQKLIFMKLAGVRKEQEDLRDLASIGVGKEILEDSNYKEFTSKLDPNLSTAEKYEIFKKFNPSQTFEQIGSMKSSNSKEAIKDFYTYEESLQFTKADYDRNPKLYEAVCNSMTKW